MNEFFVYDRLIAYLTAHHWHIICASPPGGTDARYPKCLFPRRKVPGSDKGLRDEVDLIAFSASHLLLVECKTKLSESNKTRNARGENDIEKLQRIVRMAGREIRSLLKQAYGHDLGSDPVLVPAVAAAILDFAVTNDVVVFHCQKDSVDLHGNIYDFKSK